MVDVCSFFGKLLKHKRFQKKGFRNKDIEEELKEVFGNTTSAVRKLSTPMRSPEGDELAYAIEQLLQNDWENTKKLIDESEDIQ